MGKIIIDSYLAAEFGLYIPEHFEHGAPALKAKSVVEENHIYTYFQFSCFLIYFLLIMIAYY